jgi:capsular polysaccharide biosynthesis protein
MDQSGNQEYEIDLLHLIKLVLRKWILVGAITIVVAIIAGGYAYIMLDDTYSANSSMLVQAQDTETSDYQNLLTGQRLVDTYKEIAISNRVLEELVTRIDDETISVSSLRNMITVSSVNDTLIVKLSVETKDPELSKEIANEAVSIIQELSQEFNGLQEVEVLDTAQTPSNPSGPNRLLYIAVGILLGGMIGVGLVLVIEFMDKHIRTPKDIETYLGLKVLGTIPDYDMGEEEL